MSSIPEFQQLAAYTFAARSHEPGVCGSNGLPLTSNAIQILGRYQRFLDFHRCIYLCAALDIQRCERERIIIVSEYHEINVWEARNSGLIKDEDLEKLLSQSLQALEFLHSKAVTHRNISLNNVLFTHQGNIKLAQYEIYDITKNGEHVNFFIGDLNHSAPEVLYNGLISNNQCDSSKSSYAGDLWSLAIVFLQLMMKELLFNNISSKETVTKILNYAANSENAFDMILEEHKFDIKNTKYSLDFVDTLRSILLVSTANRPSAELLLKRTNLRRFIKPKKHVEDLTCYDTFYDFQRSVHLDLNDIEVDGDDGEDGCIDEPLNLRMLYEGWTMTGGDLKSTLIAADVYPTKPPILGMPTKAYMSGLEVTKHSMDFTDTRMIPLSLQVLNTKLKQIKLIDIILGEESNVAAKQNSDVKAVPLSIREHDIEYQLQRQVLFRRLVQAYPYSRDIIWRQCNNDIPPLYRGVVWACLLGVQGDIYATYSAIDKHSPTPTDRQIDVDIPRCHQYCNLLSSGEGHSKLRRVIKAWISSHPEYVYWQGLDSLTAPFLYLNFNNEAIVYGSVSAFIEKYLKSFFLKDNSEVIQEYLAVFSQLISYHDPVLSMHMHNIEFSPDLYAIPWFLTMYAHIFPIDRIFHLWDSLILGTSSLPLFIGVAILRQLRSRLIASDFNECILLFSDLPEVNIDACLADSVQIFRCTPSSATYRKCESDRPSLGFDQRSLVDANVKHEMMVNSASLSDTKAMLCPRICITDLLNLCKSPNLTLVIDCRHYETYLKGTFAGSLNLPSDPSVNPGDLFTSLEPHLHKIKVVLGYRNQHSAKFCESLIEMGIAMVCSLHNGLEGLRDRSLLTLPPIHH